MSCLFTSLSYFISNLESTQLRNIICNYLQSNPTLIDYIKLNEITLWENNVSLDDYVQNMRKESSWGGGIEIKAFCEIFKLKVIVVFNSKEIEFLPSTPSIGEMRISYNGVHYEPIKTLKY